MLIFVSAKPSETILLIDRYKPRFESHASGKIRKTLKKDENFDDFCKFLAKAGYLPFNLKKIFLLNVNRQC